jgi:hypothetical protein
MYLVKALGEVLRRTNGRPFCDGCLAGELGVERLDVQTHWMRLPSESTEDTGAAASAAKP